MADGDRLHEVVGNLLGNAIKFTPRGGRITLRMMGTQSPPTQAGEDVRNEAPPFLLLEVEDDGPGIPREHRTGVFEKFYQVKRGVRLRGQGVGLGLAICLNVVRAHGGAIWVEEGTTGGALFRVLIPQVPRELEENARGADVRIPGGIAAAEGIPEGPSWPGPDTSPAPGDRTPQAGSGVGVT